MPSRVGINLLWLVPGSVGGSEEATVALLREIASLAPDDIRYLLFALPAFAANHPALAAAFPVELAPLDGRFKPLRAAAENSWLATKARRAGLDMVHHMGGVMPILRRCPGVLTIHDLQPFDMPDNFSSTRRGYLRHLVPRSVRRAELVLTPSEFVRQTVVDRFGVPPERVRATPWGVEGTHADVTVAEVQARYGLPRRWFVLPAVTWPHKNHLMLVRAFATVAAREHDVVLVFTGAAAQAEQEVRDEIVRLGLRGRVRRTGRIPRRDVLAIVRGAVALTFPSRYEGFGLPVLEAMSLGTPVVAAAATALPEVLAGAGRLIDPDDSEGWAAVMLELLADGDERERLAAAGHERARDFSWAAAAQMTLEAHRHALAGATP
ncbi:MAG TPA: glycosyltransferase family 1 protein [Acidimicrobiales bacterium]